MEILQTIEDYEKNKMEQRKIYYTYPRPNGLECPKCKSEMMDVDDNILCSNPPKKYISCSNCKYSTYVLA